MAEIAEPLEPAESTAETAEKPVVGRPFEKGVSGNPGGRPKGLAHASREVLRQAVADGEDPSLALVRFWASVMGDPAEKMQWRMAAADRLADRGWGKPPQYAPIEDDDPLGMSERETREIAVVFDQRIDEVAERRRAREEAAQAETA